MQCPRCGVENAEHRSACVSCFAQLDAGAAAPRLVTMAQPDHDTVNGKPQQAGTAVADASATTGDMPWMHAAEPDEPADQSKYVVPGMAGPAEPSGEAPDEDHSPWKNNPVSQMSSPGSYAGPAAPPTSYASGQAPEGLNWGAFLLPFWWSVFHKAWLWAIISFFVHPVGAIALLFTGNKVGWEKRQFASVDEFRSVQKAWIKWGIGILVVAVIMAVVLGATLVAAIKSRMSLGAMPDGTAPPTMEMPMNGMPSGQSAGTVSVASVLPFPGAKQKGSPSQGKDSDGSFTSTAYEVAASPKAVYDYFSDIASKNGSYSASLSGNTGDVSMTAKDGTVKIHIDSKTAKQTDFTINKYAGKGGKSTPDMNGARGMGPGAVGPGGMMGARPGFPGGGTGPRGAFGTGGMGGRPGGPGAPGSRK